MAKNIHDQTFKRLMTEEDFFKPFFKTYLPADIQSKLNWNSIQFLKMDGKHFSEHENNTFEADVVYSVQLSGEPGMIWVHLEHQTKTDRLMPLRILNYQTGELLAYAKANRGQKLPTIISLIYYQGTKPYSASLNLEDLFAASGLANKYFAKPILINLPVLEDDLLRKHDKIGPIELLLKHVRSKQFREKYRGIIAGIREVSDAGRRTLIYYLFRAPDLSKPDLIAALNEFLPNDREVIMTVADQLREEGWREGATQERRTLAKQLMQRLQDVVKVADLMNLSVFEVQDLLKH